MLVGSVVLFHLRLLNMLHCPGSVQFRLKCLSVHWRNLPKKGRSPRGPVDAELRPRGRCYHSARAKGATCYVLRIERHGRTSTCISRFQHLQYRLFVASVNSPADAGRPFRQRRGLSLGQSAAPIRRVSLTHRIASLPARASISAIILKAALHVGRPQRRRVVSSASLVKRMPTSPL